jgi:putative phosphoesterase
MVKIVVITDIHANLPALESVLKAIQMEGYDTLIQTGDVIGIGPYPSECIDLLLSTPRVENIKGNHETYIVDGILDPPPGYMSAGEVQHHLWEQARLTAHHKTIITYWPFLIKHEFEGVKVAFMHSGLGESGHDIQGIPRNANALDLEKLFAPYEARLVFYGHRHEDSDVQGQARYINPGSLGCNNTAIARFCVARFNHGQYQIEHRLVAYDDCGLSMAFEERQVPDRHFICRTFFGGRYIKELD